MLINRSNSFSFMTPYTLNDTDFTSYWNYFSERVLNLVPGTFTGIGLHDILRVAYFALIKGKDYEYSEPLFKIVIKNYNRADGYKHFVSIYKNNERG